MPEPSGGLERQVRIVRQRRPRAAETKAKTSEDANDAKTGELGTLEDRADPSDTILERLNIHHTVLYYSDPLWFTMERHPAPFFSHLL